MDKPVLCVILMPENWQNENGIWVNRIAVPGIGENAIFTVLDFLVPASVGDEMIKHYLVIKDYIISMEIRKDQFTFFASQALDVPFSLVLKEETDGNLNTN